MRAVGHTLNDQLMPRQRSRLRAAVNLLLLTLALPALAVAALWLLGCSNGDLSLVRFGPRGEAHPAAPASQPDEVRAASTSITPITSLAASRPSELGGSTSGSLFASADYVDIIAKSASTATLNLVYYDTTAAAWAIYGPSCSVTTDLATCRYVAKRGQFYWHVFKSAGSVSGCYIEQVYRGSSALGSIEPPVPSGLSSVSGSPPLTGDGTGGSPLAIGVASNSADGYLSAADHALLPSSGQKAALAGSSGTPGAGNVYVTDGDGRMSNSRAPTAHADSHKAGGSDPLLSAPGAIGGGTPAAITGTTITANAQFSGSGAGLTSVPATQLSGQVPVANLSTAHGAPGAIGGTTPAAGTFTALACTTVSGDGSALTALNASNLGSGTVPVARLDLSSPPAIGGTAAAAVTSTVLKGTTRTETPSVGTSSSTQHGLPSGTGDVLTTDSTATVTGKSIVASQLTGTIDIARIPTGTTSSTVPLGGVVAGAACAYPTTFTFNAAGQVTACTAGSAPPSLVVAGSSNITTNQYMGASYAAGTTTVANVIPIYRAHGGETFKNLCAFSAASVGADTTIEVYKSTNQGSTAAALGTPYSVTIANGGNEQCNTGSTIALSAGDWIYYRWTAGGSKTSFTKVQVELIQ